MLKYLSKNFDSTIRYRGLNYYQKNKVKIYSATAELLKFSVKGSREYFVDVELEPEKVTFTCDCPYFFEKGACKHIWATLLKAFDDGLLITITSKKPQVFFSRLDKKPYHTLEHIQDNTIFPQDFIDRTNHLQHNGNSSYMKKCPSDELRNKIWKQLFFASRSNVYFDNQKPVDMYYVLNKSDLSFFNRPVLSLAKKEFHKDGTWSLTDIISQKDIDSARYDNPIDRKILGSLISTAEVGKYTQYIPNTFSLSEGQVELLLPIISDNEKLYYKDLKKYTYTPVHFDPNNWILKITFKEDENKDFLFSACLIKNNMLIKSLSDGILFSNRYLLYDETLAPIDQNVIKLLETVNTNKLIIIYKEDIFDYISEFYAQYEDIVLELPESFRITNKNISPVPVLRMIEKVTYNNNHFVYGELFFDYENQIIPYGYYKNSILTSNYELIRIDASKHLSAHSFLEANGAVISLSDLNSGSTPVFKISQNRFLPLVTTLIRKGWRVEGKKAKFKLPGNFSFSVSSGIDWFDVNASCKFDNQLIGLPKILEALHKGNQFITLDDGSMGILPEDWLKKFAPLANMGEVQENTIRFRRSQALILDLLLAEQPDTNRDEIFNRICNELNSFTGVNPVNPAPSFIGKLRPYQKDGLGWFLFLQKFRFGGCLADDMGLGKTVQVLALLDSEYSNIDKNIDDTLLPSLIIVPRSLVFNWIQESSRFTPNLRICDFSSTQRNKSNIDFKSFDIILITYGTLRRDIETLHRQSFYYVVLDEAQVIKNKESITAKSVRLLNSKHRLAMSGTPIENHLGELWSIFEFLNPGMLGCSSILNSSRSIFTKPDEQTCTILRQVMHPFILRRTKKQVAADLPDRTEDIILCEMKPKQRALYDQLKNHYRASLLGQIQENGISKSTFLILEALLRLRQAACHPGLINEKYAKHPSVKLDTIIAQIKEVIDEEHKCLVFSQFTSMLAYVKTALDNEHITYEYLDGKTKDRQQHVEHFQNDLSCNVFLISLKAGAVGLNLTAAEYVFILDPWWNPAVEAQAIDRTHRIGQTKPVFAYRFICKDTVEEKILQLQSSKRNLAESVISADESLFKNIVWKDLEILFR